MRINYGHYYLYIIVEPQSKAGRSSDDDDDEWCRFGLGYYFNYVLPFNRSGIGILVGIANQNRLMSIARVLDPS